MRNIIIITIAVVLIVISVVIFTKKKNDVQGLGRFVKSTRPPKLRIVYSRKNRDKKLSTIKTSNEAYEVFKSIWSSQIETREEMYVLFLDNASQVLGYNILSSGGITGTVADLRLIFSVALESLATKIIIAHNHPSGNLNPSEADTALTRKIYNAGKVMDITLLDHLIITVKGYYSFADEGNLG
jgi:DNA repair protein RadC